MSTLPKVVVELSADQVETIVREDLMLLYKLYSQVEYDSSGEMVPLDHKILAALETVIEYYCGDDLFKRWKENQNK